MPEEEPDDEPAEDEELDDDVPEEVPLDEEAVTSSPPPLEPPLPVEPPLELDSDELPPLLVLESSSWKPPPARFPHEVMAEAVAAVTRASETDQSQKKGDRDFKEPPARIVPGGGCKRSRPGRPATISHPTESAGATAEPNAPAPEWPPMRFK